MCSGEAGTYTELEKRSLDLGTRYEPWGYLSQNNWSITYPVLQRESTTVLDMQKHSTSQSCTAGIVLRFKLQERYEEAIRA